MNILHSAFLFTLVNGHGYMYTPRSRNWIAYEEGIDSWVTPEEGTPLKEYCYHCLSTNDETQGSCGESTQYDYNNWLDSTGNGMPFTPEEMYMEGQIITVKSHITTHKNGHIQLRVCSAADNNNDPTACYGNYLEFVEDLFHGMPKDVNYPERGYLAGKEIAGDETTFEMKFKLPMGVAGDEMVLQWRYITATSCNPEGYIDYPFPRRSDWDNTLSTCITLNENGQQGVNLPEQFFNCASIKIIGDDSTTTNPTKSPSSSPSASPSKSPSTTASESQTTHLTCSDEAQVLSTVDALGMMDDITYTVSSDPLVLSVIASGGAAGSGSAVSESQAYGLLAAALALADMDPNDAEYEDVKNKFLGYFNGWKTMCRNSGPPPCQSTTYCVDDGELFPCLPGWKHNGDLTNVEGTGSAPDADADAIVGMIIGVKALEENDDLTQEWQDNVDEIKDWADRSCTSFMAYETVLSDSGNHRLLKLGSCWGGWESNGNNPSYHSPSHYRMMRDFQASISSRSYALPNTGDNLSWEEKWNMLIDTSYKFLQVAQCPDKGLVPNWALVAESANGDSLESHPGSFSGSGTPQYEFGSEAARTMWRVAFDALAYPEEAESQAFGFLDVLNAQLVEYFDTSDSLFFKSNALSTCEDGTYPFQSWRYNGFIFAPVYSTLAAYWDDDSAVIEPFSFDRQDMVDAACSLVGSTISSQTYYSRSWQVLSYMALNGAVSKAGELFRDDNVVPTSSPSTSPFTSLSPSSSPSMNPTNSPSSSPSKNPTSSPSTSPSKSPSVSPSISPSKSPSNAPSASPIVTCLPKASRVKLQSNTGAAIQILELQVFSSGQNVATGELAWATQSSTYREKNRFKAPSAIDGSSSTFSHTESGSCTWFQVNLGNDLFPIESIRILNRGCRNNDEKGCLCRLSYTTVSLLDNDGNWVDATLTGDMCGQSEWVHEFTQKASYCSVR